MEISRRSFLEGAIAAGGTVALGALAGCSPQAASSANATTAAVSTGNAATPSVEDIIIPHTASAKVTDFAGCTFTTDEPAPLDPPASWDKETDVVVAGTGGGLAGAARAAFLGHKVVALDAADTYGGTSKSACLYYTTTGTRCQLAAGLPDVTDKLQAALEKSYPTGEKYPKFIANCLQGIRDLVNWTEDLGMTWEPGWIDGQQKVAITVAPGGTQEGGNSYRMMKVTEDFYDKIFKQYGGEYLFKTPITGLVMDKGKVVGVQATPEGADPIYIKANKGVILATGGMCNNINMLKRYCPDGFETSMVSNAGTYDNGDGIRIGLGAGAQLDGYNIHGHFDGGIEGVGWNHLLYAADIQIARQPWLQMDTMGSMMTYSIAGYEDYGDMIRKMPESKVYSFFDANWEKYCANFVLPMCRNLTKPDMPNQDRWGGLLDNDYRNGVNDAIEQGRIKQGDTPEELAEQLGVDPTLVKNAFKKWNDMVASGDGTAYGYEADWLHPLDTPPYYGQALGVMMYSTRSGLSINENLQVVSESGAVIPGLYAAGMTSGRPGTSPLCGDVGYAATSAFLAANHIDKNA